ncbi:MAG: hypothetical protein K9K67_10165 [Bacteriovoracaceae bacterium]|nr:hypothetical protein [Bacteriovoracaceae bacterium]
MKYLLLITTFLFLYSCSSNIEKKVSKSIKTEPIKKTVEVDLLDEAIKQFNEIQKSGLSHIEKMNLKADLGGEFYFHARSMLNSGNSALAIKYLKFSLMCNPAPPFARTTQPLLKNAIDVFISSTYKFDSCNIISERTSFLDRFAPDKSSLIRTKFQKCFTKKAVVNQGERRVDLSEILNLKLPETNRLEEIQIYQDLENELDYVLKMRSYFPIYQINLLRLLAHKHMRFETQRPELYLEKTNSKKAWIKVPVKYIEPPSVIIDKFKELVHFDKGLGTVSVGEWERNRVKVSKNFTRRIQNLLKKENPNLERYLYSDYTKNFAMPLFFLKGKYKIKLNYKDGTSKFLNKNFTYNHYHSSGPFCFRAEDSSRNDGSDMWTPCVSGYDQDRYFTMHISKNDLKGLIKVDVAYDLDYLHKTYIK